jgi:hypothetical protein
MSGMPIPISSITTSADPLTEIRNEYSTRQKIRESLAKLAAQRASLNRDAVAKWSTEVAARGLDPVAAMNARDGWKKADDILAAQQQAIENLSSLLDQQIAGHKKSDQQGVAIVLRERISALSAARATQEKQEDDTERQLKTLLDELAEVDPTARPAPYHKETTTKAGAAARGDGANK